MTDRIIALTVVLDRELREDDCQNIIDAIKMVKGVARVTTEKSDASYYSALEQTKLDIKKKLFEVLK